MPEMVPVRKWPRVIGTYALLRKKLEEYKTVEQKVAALAYWDTLIQKDIEALTWDGQLPRLPKAD